MKKTFKFFAAALAIVAAASCAKEISNDDIQAPEQELVHKVFTASLNVDPETKTTLHTDGVSVHWTENDAIRIAPENTASWGEDLPAIAIDETFAVFEGDVIDSDKYWAVYPAGAVNTTNNFGGVWGWKTDKSTIILSNELGALATQYAVDNNFSIAGAFMASSNFAVSVSSDDNPTTLSFKNINAYLKVNLAMDNASKIELSSDAVSSVPSASGELTTTSDSELGGPIVLNFNSKTAMDAGRNCMPHVGIYNSTVIITFAYENGENLKSGVNYYIAIPAVKIEGLKLVVKDSNGKVLQTMTKKSTFNAESNKIYNLGVIEAAKVEPAKVGDYFYSDGTYSSELDSNKETVGVVFYVGDPTADDSILKRDYPSCTNGLVVGLKKTSVQWLSENRSVYEWAVNNGYHTLQQFTYGSGGVKENKYAQYKWGYNNTSAIRKYASLNGLTSGLVSFADTYDVFVEGASSWYIPSIAEMQLVRKAGLKSKVQSLGGDSLSGTSYYTSSEEDSSSYIPTITFEVGSLYDGGSKKSYDNVFAIFAF